ncbi:hemophore-related protein [Rhodococcus spongiicola]|uniref:Hemophore-related protein n=1 Tax=Rhodococcus spongiicola TaxID=2487352 RepID=A0A438B6T9_9NOCA|nr:hemophore-related protein [Rhodococcus spongiicola]RVW06675.1 hemophore-related protein [Rhodococcus spongiicola]
MSISRTRLKLGIAAAGAVAAAVLVPGVASAQPGPLASTTCSADQIDAAIRAEAPQLAAWLDENPEAKEKREAFWAKSPEERQGVMDNRDEKREAFRAMSPEERQAMSENRDRPGKPSTSQRSVMSEKAQVIADTCGNY